MHFCVHALFSFRCENRSNQQNICMLKDISVSQIKIDLATYYKMCNINSIPLPCSVCVCVLLFTNLNVTARQKDRFDTRIITAEKKTIMNMFMFENSRLIRCKWYIFFFMQTTSAACSVLMWTCNGKRTLFFFADRKKKINATRKTIDDFTILIYLKMVLENALCIRQKIMICTVEIYCTQSTVRLVSVEKKNKVFTRTSWNYLLAKIWIK